MRQCGCVAYHLAMATETLKALRGRFAIVAIHCSDCGTSYWSFLDPARMSGVQDVVDATRTKSCAESELRNIVAEMIQRASHTGIAASQIDCVLKQHGSGRKPLQGPRTSRPADQGTDGLLCMSVHWAAKHSAAVVRLRLCCCQLDRLIRFHHGCRQPCARSI